MRSVHQRTIEHLARESQVPVDEVAQLYDNARAELEAGARIKGFIGIFAIRNVRRLLRQRKLQASALVLCIAFAGWPGIADAALLSSPPLTCVGEFSATEALGDVGQLRCSNGASAAFES